MRRFHPTVPSNASTGVTFNALVEPGEVKAAKPANASVKYDTGIADAISSTLAYTNEDLGLTVALGYNKNVQSKLAALNGYGSFATPLVLSTAAAGTDGSSNNYAPADGVTTARTDIVRLVASQALDVFERWRPTAIALVRAVVRAAID